MVYASWELFQMENLEAERKDLQKLKSKTNNSKNCKFQQKYPA